MSEDSEIVTLLYTQFANGQINGHQFATALAIEREKEKSNYEALQTSNAELREALETAIDVIEMNDARLVQLGDPAGLVYSDDHNRFRKVIRDLLAKQEGKA